MTLINVNSIKFCSQQNASTLPWKLDRGTKLLLTLIVIDNLFIEGSFRHRSRSRHLSPLREGGTEWPSDSPHTTAVRLPGAGAHLCATHTHRGILDIRAASCLAKRPHYHQWEESLLWCHFPSVWILAYRCVCLSEILTFMIEWIGTLIKAVLLYQVLPFHNDFW